MKPTTLLLVLIALNLAALDAAWILSRRFPVAAHFRSGVTAPRALVVPDDGYGGKPSRK